MEEAIKLAKKGAGYVSPNPMVGCVIVKNNKIIGSGWHKKYGEAHSEVNAINSATENIEGSEVYVTLEPCSHYGKTPPCAKALIEHKIKKVYVGCLDPNPLVSGNGVKMLRDAGIEVEIGVMEDECKKINPIFFKYIRSNTPFVVMKSAITLDGKIATYTGDSKWVSNEQSRQFCQELRHNLKAIMVGINTVLADNPHLTCRKKGGINPIRIIVDSKLRIPLDANVLKITNDDRCIIATTKNIDVDKSKLLEDKGIEILQCNSLNGQVDLKDLMKRLGEIKIDSILLEGGGTLNYSALEAGIVDYALTFISPKFIGGENAKTSVEGTGFANIKDAIKIENPNVTFFGEDILVYGGIKCLQE